MVVLEDVIVIVLVNDDVRGRVRVRVLDRLAEAPSYVDGLHVRV